VPFSLLGLDRLASPPNDENVAIATPFRICTIFGVPEVAGASCLTIVAGFQLHCAG
jgi:hypothetical protein